MKILNKNKVLGLFIISLFLVCLITQPVSAAKNYHDYYWKGSYVQASESSITKKIPVLKDLELSDNNNNGQ